MGSAAGREEGRSRLVTVRKAGRKTFFGVLISIISGVSESERRVVAPESPLLSLGLSVVRWNLQFKILFG